MSDGVATEADRKAVRFGTLVGCRRVWVISSIHADVTRLEGIHDAIEQRLQPRDALVYLGNMIGRGTAVRETVAELLAFRRGFIARASTFAADLVFLRGSQEEMWHRLLELQFAHNPGDVLAWMLDHGVGPLIEAYGIEIGPGIAACREGPLAITRWTTAIRTAMNGSPGHANLLTALRRAAYTSGGELLFVHAGIDASRPLHAQQDSFWWGGAGFFGLDQPYAGYKKVVRGFDRQHSGLKLTENAISIDRGCGFKGPLACACLDLDGAIVESFEA